MLTKPVSPRTSAALFSRFVSEFLAAMAPLLLDGASTDWGKLVEQLSGSRV